MSYFSIVSTSVSEVYYAWMSCKCQSTDIRTPIEERAGSSGLSPAIVRVHEDYPLHTILLVHTSEPEVRESYHTGLIQ